MEIVVHVDPGLAPALRGDAAPTSSSAALQDHLDTLGMKLTALFPDISDDAVELSCQFSGDAPEQSAEEILDGLQGWPGVTAAYSKAPGALP